MVSLNTYNSVPNITSANNSLKVWNGLVWSTISIPEGSYDIDAIINAISGVVGSINDVEQVKFTANTATLKTTLRLVSPYQVDFGVPYSISSVLGFHKRIYYATGNNESENTVNILNVTNFKVVTNIVTGTFNNDKVDNVVYSFFPDVPPGYKILEKPLPIYLPVSVDRINDLYAGLVDQDNKPINLRSETLTIRFNIRET